MTEKEMDEEKVCDADFDPEASFCPQRSGETDGLTQEITMARLRSQETGY